MADYPAVLDLWLHTPGMGLNSLDDSEEGIRSYLARNPETCFVAREGEALVGAILAGHDGRRGFIYHLAVRVEARGRGIGEALVKRAEEALQNEGIHKVALVVFAKNEGGNAFWGKVGYDAREDLVYRSRVISKAEMKRIDT